MSGKSTTIPRRAYFLGGPARSGSTLLQGILCSAPNANPLVSEAAPVTILVEAYARMLHHVRVFPGMYFEDARDVCNLFASYLRELVGRVAVRYQADAVVLKAPVLSRHFSALRELSEAAGLRGYFLCSVRDPRAAVASMVEMDRRKRAEGQPIFERARDIQGMSRHYNQALNAVYRVEDQFSARELKFVTYESLVRDPRSAIEDLSAFTGLDLSRFDASRKWPDSELDFSRRDNPFQAAVTPLYGGPVSAQRIDAYRLELTPGEIRHIERSCAATLSRFDYRPDNMPGAVEPLTWRVRRVVRRWGGRIVRARKRLAGH